MKIFKFLNWRVHFSKVSKNGMSDYPKWAIKKFIGETVVLTPFCGLVIWKNNR